MTDSGFSKDALIAFLREGAMSGLINPARARSRLNAVEQLAVGLTEEEAADVRSLDVQALRQRMHKLQGSSIRPEVLEIYGERMASALDSFLNGGDPSSPRKDGRTGRRNAAAAAKPLEPGEQAALEELKLDPPENPREIFPIPIREDCIVYVQNVPLDMTAEEANKVCRVVKALAAARSK